MDDVFFSEVDLNGQPNWDAVGNSDISLGPTDSDSDGDVLAVQMDISSPLLTLKVILGQKLGADLSNCEVWLQDVLQLNDDTTLSEQCVQGEGLVQVNLELKSVQNIDRINIIDVLKPHLEEIESNEAQHFQLDEEPKAVDMLDQNSIVDMANDVEYHDSNSSSNTGIPTGSTASSSLSSVKISKSNKLSSKLPSAQNENITRWVMDGNFRKEQERLKIPLDPVLWSHAHVQHWIKWAINQFSLKNVTPTQWTFVDGPALCNMTHTEFTQKIPRNPLSKDPNHDLFWTHLELLRKCKFVGVIQKPVPYLQYITTPLTVKSDVSRVSRPAIKLSPTKRMPPDSFSARSFSMTTSGNRSGSNGQVQLWQFLLELLTDRNFRDAISWMGTGGEFKLNNPEMVAQLWGERKNKPHMNYEKLSRALRYYYDGDMICKVSGKRFVYKFVCDLKQLLGYSADELNKLVTECEQRSKLRRTYPYV